MPNYSLTLLEKTVKTDKLIADKIKEIEKRREVIETTSSTLVSRKKDEARIEAIDDKIAKKTAMIDKTITYYQGEIEKNQKKLDDELAALEAKFELAKKKVEDKYFNYRDYCMKALSSEQEKRTILIEPYEKKKEQLEQIQQKTEDDDKILVRLKIELKQLQDQRKEEEDAYDKVYREEREARERQQREAQREAEEKIRIAEAEQRAKDMQEYQIRQNQIEAERQERRERNAQLRKEEEEKKNALADKKTMIKENLRIFKKDIYPNLTDRCKDIYSFLKTNENYSDPECVLHQEAEGKPDVEACEEFLSQYGPDMDLITDFEKKGIHKLTNRQKSEYEDKGVFDKIEFVRTLQSQKKTTTVIPRSSLSMLS